MVTPAAQAREVISFGPFSLIADERVLTRNGVPVALSARAFDILLALLSRPNEVISKGDLLRQVWSGVTVEEGSLRFHIASLRKALGDRRDGARYIATSRGRGYSFVVAISRSSDRTQATVEADFRHANVPGRPSGMVGRGDDLLKLSSRLSMERFVTIVGSGGVGKTTIAIALAHQLLDDFAGAVLFVDLSVLNDPGLVAMTVASMLGLSVQSHDATPNLVAYLRDKRILLILDTCEHVIEAAAALASNIFAAAPHVHILTTSRETLRVKGEHVYRLEPLACPPDEPGLTAAIARTFPATQLFVERAMASGAPLEFTDAEAAIVVGICRKLDGLALAIELAARRVEAYGLQETAALLDRRLTLRWVGSRTAPQRQKTLQATLDWSYGLLSETERLVLRRLAVFVGHFALDAALAVVTGATIDQLATLSALDGLVAKSMVVTRPLGAMMRYRLLDTTRAYVLAISIDETEAADVAIRHAKYYRKWLAQSGTEWSTLSTGTERAPYFAGLNNVRAALEWCFDVNGNTEIGVELAAAAGPVFLAMSLLPECRRWSEQAVLALGEAGGCSSEEMYLQACLGISSMQMYAESAAARLALKRSLAIAEERGDAVNEVGALGMLHMYHFRAAELKTARQYAERSRSVARTLDDPAAIALSHSILGKSLHLAGDIHAARGELETARQHWSRPLATRTIYFGYDPHFQSGIVLAPTLWLLGHPAQAVQRTEEAIKDAERMGHPTSLALVLAWAASVYLWIGDLQEAEKCIDSSIVHAETYSLRPLVALGRARKGEVAIRRGQNKEGVKHLQTALQEIHAAHQEVLTTEFNIALAQGLAGIDRFAEGMRLIDETMRWVEINEALVYLPELLRVKAGFLLSAPQADRSEAKKYLVQSLELSRRQGTRAWELRTAIDLARLLADHGQPGSGQALLQPIYTQFVEGFDTADLKAAGRLLAALA